jgi:hypothetical protein
MIFKDLGQCCQPFFFIIAPEASQLSLIEFLGKLFWSSLIFAGKATIEATPLGLALAFFANIILGWKGLPGQTLHLIFTFVSER